jgi:hypothetical protein
MSCSDCHSPHAVKAKAPVKARDTCKGCHGTTYDVDKNMPGLPTAGNLFVRSHRSTNQARNGAAGDRQYFYKSSGRFVASDAVPFVDPGAPV